MPRTLAEWLVATAAIAGVLIAVAVVLLMLVAAVSLVWWAFWGAP